MSWIDVQSNGSRCSKIDSIHDSLGANQRNVPQTTFATPEISATDLNHQIPHIYNGLQLKQTVQDIGVRYG